MVQIYGENGTENEKHDCSKCDKIPAAIKVRQSRDGKEYSGVLSLNDAIFDYSFKLVGEFPKTFEELEKSVQFSFRDADGKEIAFNKTIESYMKTLVTSAATQLAMQAQSSGVREIASMLEEVLGSANALPEISTEYNACQKIIPEIRQFIEDYKIRGQKAK